MKKRILNVFLPVLAMVFFATCIYADDETCVKPFTIPDKWIENTDPPLDETDTYATRDEDGNPLPNADVYIPFGDPDYSGYKDDHGTQLTLVASDGNIQPSFYFPWALPGSTGGDDYRENISGCNTSIIRMSDPITLEPGNKTGPTTHGVEDLIAQDPNAHWDDACQCVKGSTQPVSPRVITIPVYDPSFFETGTQNGRNADLKVANFIGFFIEGFDADGNPFGRITRRDGLRSEDCKNGADDDGDGAVDCADSDCANDPGCQPVP